jgi:hypothetical protein
MGNLECGMRKRKEMVHRAPGDRVKAGCRVSAPLVAEAASLIEVETSLEPKNAHFPKFPPIWRRIWD